MGKFIVLFALIGSAVCQFPISTTNYQTADSARQENVDQQGNIQGQYSYVDPNGKTITVKYTSGKNGFQVQGDHLPVAPQGFQPQNNALPQSYPQYQGASGFSPSSFGSSNFGASSLGSTGFGSSGLGQGNLGAAQSFQSFNQQPNFGAQQTNFGFGAPNKPLFTPSTNVYPAASAGQIDNYRKALEEEREEAQKAALGQSALGQNSFSQTGFGQSSFGQSSLGQNQGLGSGLTFGQNHRFGAPVGAPSGIPQNPYNLQYGADNGFSFEYNL